MENIIENNKVSIQGEVAKEPEFSHELYGENFYIVELSVRRLSDNHDTVLVMVSERLVNIADLSIGTRLSVSGQFRSYNKHDNERNQLLLSVFARTATIWSQDTPDNGRFNTISLDGYICKQPVYRETPQGREITDLLIAVNRPYGKTDYIPCITWGRNARFTSQLEISTHVAVEGRIQSREYLKRYADGTEETKMAFEVSVSSIKEVL